MPASVHSLLLLALLAASTVTGAPSSDDKDLPHGVDKEEVKQKLSHWAYTGEHGVDHWAHYYDACGGERQSPINIQVADTVHNEELLNIDLVLPDDISAEKPITMVNNGHSVSHVLEAPIIITGGGLIDQYQAAGFHFHWGRDSSLGSEHTVDGRAFPLEMHIVTYDIEKYGTLTEAVDKTDALAVLGVFFEISKEDNPKLNPVIEYLSDVKTPGQPVTLPLFDITELLPANNRDYYRYLGSLTTPGCFESVIWTLFKTPQKISESQMSQFRALYDTEENALVDNYRPTQLLHGRQVSRSFPVQVESENNKQPAVNANTDSDGGGAASMAASVAALVATLMATLWLV